MDDRLEISTLGGLGVQLASKPIEGLASRKANALMAYLAIEAGPHPRELLADLLWDDFSHHRAMANLRFILWSLRKRLDPFLSIDHHSVELLRSRSVCVDATDFEQCLQDGLCQEAIAHYHGDFLQGFHIQRAPMFTHWALVHRERLHQLAWNALNDLVDRYADQGLCRQAIPYAQRLVELNPFMDSSYRRMMRLLARTDQREEALEHYRRCEEALREELGIEPSDETKALNEQIKSGSFFVGIQEPQPRHNLPSRLTPFFGRQREIAEIAFRITKPACRLLTILGPGGIGKSRLAMEFSLRNGHLYADGIFYISLVGVSTVDGLLTSLADSMGLVLAAGGDPKRQVINQLKDKEALLFIDNFEHLLEGSEIVFDILAGTRQIKILATSRSRLLVQGEHVLNLRGLDFPTREDNAEILASSSVEMFLEIADRRRGSGPDVAEELSSIGEICRSVEGMPLAVELAASWTAVLTPSEIRDRILRDTSILESNYGSGQQRHRSVLATFDYSWTMLSEALRRVLMAMSVFRGGCTLEAAETVSGASPQDLMALVDKSLIWRNQSGRFEMHELLRTYAEARLEAHPELQASIRTLHCAYYAQFLTDREADVMDFEQNEVLLEMRNLRASWRYACDQGYGDEIIKMHYPLAWIFERQGWVDQGEDLFSYAADKFARHPGDAVRRALGAALTCLGMMRTRKGNLSAGTTALEEAQSIFRSMPHGREANFCNLIALAFSDLRFRPPSEIRNFVKDALEASADSESGWLRVLLLGISGSLLLEREEIDHAEARYFEALSAGKKINYRYAEAYCADGLGRAAYLREEYRSAAHYFKVSADYHLQIGWLPRLAEVTDFLAHAELECGDFDHAYKHYQDALAIYRNLDLESDVSAMLTDIAYYHIRRKNYKRALGALLRSVDVLWEKQFPAYELYILGVLAMWFLETGRDRDALDLLPILSSQRQLPKFARRIRIKDICARLQEKSGSLVPVAERQGPSLMETRERLRKIEFDFVRA